MAMTARWNGPTPAPDDFHHATLTPTDVRAFASDMGLDDCCDHCGWPVGPEALHDGGWTFCDRLCHLNATGAAVTNREPVEPVFADAAEEAAEAATDQGDDGENET